LLSLSKFKINLHNNISTIGYESGFNDISYFSRTFKKLTGKNAKTFMIEHRLPKIK